MFRDLLCRCRLGHFKNRLVLLFGFFLAPLFLLFFSCPIILMAQTIKHEVLELLRKYRLGDRPLSELLKQFLQAGVLYQRWRLLCLPWHLRQLLQVLSCLLNDFQPQLPFSLTRQTCWLLFHRLQRLLLARGCGCRGFRRLGTGLRRLCLLGNSIHFWIFYWRLLEPSVNPVA